MEFFYHSNQAMRVYVNSSKVKIQMRAFMVYHLPEYVSILVKLVNISFTGFTGFHWFSLVFTSFH